VGVPFSGKWAELLNSDAGVYAGSNIGNGGAVVADEVKSHGQAFSLALDLPPLAVVVFKPVGE